MPDSSKETQYSPEEAQERFERTLRGALTTSPKPLAAKAPAKGRGAKKPSKASA